MGFLYKRGIRLSEKKNVPEHVAIILDGNGRWAKKRGLPRKAGHVAGAKALDILSRDAFDLGIKYMTVYAFSTENWARPEDEVGALMKLLRSYINDRLKKGERYNIRYKAIGDMSKLDEKLQEGIERLVEKTKDNTGLTVTIALNYGSRDEILRAMRTVAEDVRAGRLSPEEIDDDLFSSRLDTAGIPDPDLLIRTSGEERLSNFLLWQLAYTEFYFTDVLWPDFDIEELKKAIEYYQGKDRRFGGVK